MTNREQAKMTALDGISSYMSETDVNTVLSANVPFTTERGGFDAAYVDVKMKAAATGADNSGFTIAKQNNKILMANLVAQFAGYAAIKWDEDNLNKPELEKKMHIHPSYYMDLSDAKAASEAQLG